MKTVLMIAFHYPPAGFSSGFQRTLKFSQYLPENGWRPIVLTAHPVAYHSVRDDQLRDVHEELVVRRAFALDTARHLALFGRYPRALALPDRYVTWWPFAVVSGVNLIRRYRPDVIWSTYPIATALRIAATLQRLSGLPWVADFRDSMTEEHYPPDPRQWRAYRKIEAMTVTRCVRAVFTTHATRDMYRARYGEIKPSQFAVIPNGYDEGDFRTAEALATKTSRSGDRPFELVHSGTIYDSERDPREFFAAIADLKASGRITHRELHVTLRASGLDERLRGLLSQYAIDDIVHLEPGIPYREALREMLDADGLLILQASNCNHQVPAKIYEYLRAGRPILALTDPEGETALVVRDARLYVLEPLSDKDRIARGLLQFLDRARGHLVSRANSGLVASHSRRSRTSRLATLLDDAVQSSERPAEVRRVRA